MKIEIEVRDLTLTVGLSAYVRRRLQNALNLYADRIERIALVLDETRGSHQELDYRSQIRVEAAHLPALAIEESGEYLSLAVDRAVGRAERELACTIPGNRDRVSFDREYGSLPNYGPEVSGLDRVPRSEMSDKMLQRVGLPAAN